MNLPRSTEERIRGGKQTFQKFDAFLDKIGRNLCGPQQFILFLSHFFLSQILFLYRNEKEGMCRIYETGFGSIFTQLGFLSLYCEGIKSINCYCKYIEVGYIFNQ